FRADPGHPGHRRTADECALRLRAALARAVQRGGIPRLQQNLCRHARRVGPVRARDQSGRAQHVCPQIDPPSEPSFHAFAYTVLAPDAPPSFVIAGSGEVPEGHKDYFDHIIARGDVGPSGLREKARFVLAEMERRLSALGFAWHDTTATQVYTV